MSNSNYRIKVRVGFSGTVTNPDGLDLDYTDAILSEVVFVADFPAKPGLPAQKVTLRESAGQITVDRSATTIAIAYPVSAFSDIYTDGRKPRRGYYSVHSEDGSDARTDILRGVIVAEGSSYSRARSGVSYYG